jgi:hypothetical protein
MFIYSKTHCHLCKNNLFEEKRNSCCICKKCYNYVYRYEIGQISLHFRDDNGRYDFEFWEKDNLTIVYKYKTPRDNRLLDCYDFPQIIEINKENYLSVFEKLKTLKIFL